MLVRQPNGKFCSYDYGGSNKKLNLTEQDVIDLYIKMAKDEMDNAKHYGVLVENGWVNDAQLKAMGSDKTFAELIKYVPCKPVNKKYVHCDFTTYASCPSCGNRVQDCMGRADEKCEECGQLLKWK